MHESFSHSVNVTVRFHEVDMLGVCNNAVYLSYFEEARIAMIRDMGLLPEGGIFTSGHLFFMVRNEIDYHSHSRYADVLKVESRISYIKNSSYGFKHRVTRISDGMLIASGGGVVAQVNRETGKKENLTDEFIQKVIAFQGETELRRN